MIGLRRLNAGCAARRGLILLIRYRVPIGSATSTLVQRGAFINAHRTVLLVRPWWHAGRQRLSACSCLLLVWHIHRKIGMSGGLFTNQLLRETAVEIDPGRVERLQRAHARAYQQYSVQIPLPGARKLLAWLTEMRIPWAIATSGRMETAAANLATLNVDPCKRCDNHARSGQARNAGSVPGRSRPSRCPHRKGDCGRGQYLRYARGNTLPDVGDRTAQRRIQFR
jgi:hypothetical protein